MGPCSRCRRTVARCWLTARLCSDCLPLDALRARLGALTLVIATLPGRPGPVRVFALDGTAQQLPTARALSYLSLRAAVLARELEAREH